MFDDRLRLEANMQLTHEEALKELA